MACDPEKEVLTSLLPSNTRRTLEGRSEGLQGRDSHNEDSIRCAQIGSSFATTAVATPLWSVTCDQDKLHERFAENKLASTAAAEEFCLIDLSKHRAAAPERGLVPQSLLVHVQGMGPSGAPVQSPAFHASHALCIFRRLPENKLFKTCSVLRPGL